MFKSAAGLLPALATSNNAESQNEATGGTAANLAALTHTPGVLELDTESDRNLITEANATTNLEASHNNLLNQLPKQFTTGASVSAPTSLTFATANTNRSSGTFTGQPRPAAAVYNKASALNSYAPPMSAYRPVSPSESVSSSSSRSTTYKAQEYRRKAELLQEQSEILRHREALVIQERELLDRMETMCLDDQTNYVTEHPPECSTLIPKNVNANQSAEPYIPNLSGVAAPKERASNTRHLHIGSGVIPETMCSQPEIVNPSVADLQALLDRITYLERQLQTAPTTNQICFPLQTSLASPPDLPATMGNSIPSHRRLTREQIAARNSLAKELPKFDGKPSEWPLFYATFKQTTEICGFSDAENLLRLRKSLEGPARNAVKNLYLHSSCVPQVISTLQMRFGRPELIISELQQQIFELPLPSESQLETIVDFAIAVQNICATMKASGLDNHLSNPELEQKLVSKLPGLLPAYWGMHKQGLTNCSLQVFSDWLFQLAQGANCVLVPVDQAKIRKRGSINHHTKSEMPRSQRWDTVRRNKLCYKCLKTHPFSDCKSNSACKINGCLRYHHPLLHNDSTALTGNISSNVTKKTQMANINAHNLCEGSTLFRILPVILHAGPNAVSTYAFIDDGSSVTLIDDNLLKKLDVRGTPQPLCLRWTGDTHRYENDSTMVDLAISSRYGNERFPIKAVRSVKKLELPIQSIDAEKLKSKFKYLRGIPLQSYHNAVPQLLIGLNNAALGSAIKFRQGGNAMPIAEKTKLGWTVKGHGSTAPQDPTKYIYHICNCSEHKELLEVVKSFICLHNLGVKANGVALTSKEDQLATQLLEQYTVRVGDCFETALLWKHPNMQLPDSLPMAKYRAQCLLKKMQRDPKLAELLQAKIIDYLRKGYARRMTTEDTAVERYWYLPVFAVSNANKPGKVRLVWDAAAKVNGISLNSMLLSGPDLTTPLLTVLFKFRQKRIAITADIEEMFHQIRIRSEDQNFLRFLWYEPNTTEPSTFIMSVMTFGSKCSPSCAQFVKNKNATQFQNEFPNAVRCILENHYVDDMLDSVDTEEEAVQLALDVKYVHAKGGFNIRNFLSNSNQVLKTLGAKSNESLCLSFESELPTEKVLGIWWIASTDHLAFRVSSKYKKSELIVNQCRPTKREVLSLVMSIYDPIGFIAFYVVFAKIILQEIWRSGCDWDERISDDQFSKWLRWLRLIPQIEKMRIPRHYSCADFNNPPQIELHTFVDASEASYAAVCYMRFSDEKMVDCAFVSSKTRVAPLKIMSIPRLELKAALLGARLAKYITESHSSSIKASVFWSDSRTVLAWLQADPRRYKQFVAFRVSEILELTNLSEWRWVPTAENVADEATKWRGDPDFSSESRWLKGPPFLRLSPDEWPVQGNTTHSEFAEELRPQYVGHHQEMQYLRPLTAQPERFSTWGRLLRATAKIIDCARAWLSKIRGGNAVCNTLSSEDLSKAQIQLWKRAQIDVFSDEIASLLKGKPIQKSSDIFKLSPYLDSNNILRVDGRINIVGREDPVLLPRHHLITCLILNEFHIKYHHGCLETVVNEVRQYYWIPKLRIAANQIRRSCQFCKNRSAQPRTPKMAPLPACRTADHCRPFSYTAVDYFGPLLVTVKRSSEKRYVVLFTCLTIRAVHIEIAHSLSTDSCILAVRNFIARRGSPLEIWSDNGTNFKGTERELQYAFSQIDQNQLAKTFTSPATKWHFIPPASPHMGGAWERMVRSIKSVLYRIMQSSNTNDELLRSALMEAEMIVNSRPLTYIPLDHETEEALTPNHFLLGSSSGVKPIAEPVTEGIGLRRGWRTSQQLADAFWRRWIMEYLPIITRRSKWFSDVKPIDLGDIVYIVDQNNPRNCWPKGRVIGVRKSPDGRIRSATIKTMCGVYERPAAKIAVLDLNVVHPNGQAIPGGSVTNSLAASPLRAFPSDK